ncbi:MAG: hypothetical protein V2J62_01995 [candidate division KSB1 bacterium]|jgi:hypothetical protein|nr:hypothetical protein [candidate division KSB1 bacterium]
MLKNIVIRINDKPVQMNEFVRSIISKVIIAMVSSLSLDESPEKIEITLSK